MSNEKNSKFVDFYFDVGSPAAYLAWTQMPKLIEETGATINYKPMYISGVFKLTGNDTPITVPAKGKWIFQDFARWAKRYDVPLVVNSKFPVNSLYMMRGIIAYKDDKQFMDLTDAMFDAMWVSNKDVTNPEVMAEIASSVNIDINQFAKKLQTIDTKQILIDATQEAVDRGAFGAPTFFVGEEMHFGQDRFEFISEALNSI